MHYFCSDMHGQYAMYRAMLDLIRFDSTDHLYVLGDVIDRGPNPVDILLDLMNRENVTFILGNHEHMMLTALRTRDQGDLSLWMYNGGKTTLKQLAELDRETRKDLMDWIKSRPLAIPNLDIHGRKYYLAHACHAEQPLDDILYYADADEQTINQIVWSKDYRNLNPEYLDKKYEHLYRKYTDTTLLIGHSMAFACSYGIVSSDRYCRISRARHGHLINLDCGCASVNALGCLRIEDGKEFYVEANPLSDALINWRNGNTEQRKKEKVKKEKVSREKVEEKKRNLFGFLNPFGKKK